jgi:hypothetical protein
MLPDMDPILTTLHYRRILPEVAKGPHVTNLCSNIEHVYHTRRDFSATMARCRAC